MGRDFAPSSLPQRRRQLADAPEVRRPMEHCDGPFRLSRCSQRRSAATASAARVSSGGGLDVFAQPPEGASLRGGSQGPPLRDMRSGRDLAWFAHGVDLGSHQWRSKRSSTIEFASGVSELRGDSPYPLWSQEPPSADAEELCAVQQPILPKIRRPALLLTSLRNSLGSSGQGSPWCEASRAAAAFRADPRDREARLRGRWSSLWRVGLCDS